ncbi:AAA family ATPase [Geomonas subterranea]|uniref:AAA family ATPase n=1 Tax=Geomonas subterranea TaxID=2847989 RepID=UPI001CD5BC51|nr:AAA family ATPase [Geomonas fuzhouensis]
MRIKAIKIEKLFEIFDYDISFSENENVLIITGPNGFGKTMILNIIFNLFNRRFLFFHKLIFTKIVLQLDDGISITIRRIGKDNKPTVSFVFQQNGKEIETFDYSTKLESDVERNVQKYLPVGRMSVNKWIDHRSGRILSLDDLLNEYADQLPEEVSKNLLRIKSDKVNMILDSLQVHLIREQRLFKKMEMMNNAEIRYRHDRNYREEKEQTIMMESIQTYAKELKQLISNISQESFKQTQALDSSYPDRLINETNRLTEKEYTLRFNDLKTKQDKLTEFGLYESKQKFLAYSQDDSKALSVYLKDFEIKLSVFDDLLDKLELFTSILNQRRFTFKTIAISREKGFLFKTRNGNELELNQLSSGEQHEVVLLYELIFNVRPNTLVLIDEPEISLHVTWQKEFLNDLLRIIKIQNIQVVIATHSPSIINGRWDLAYNLEKEGSK